MTHNGAAQPERWRCASWTRTYTRLVWLPGDVSAAGGTAILACGCWRSVARPCQSPSCTRCPRYPLHHQSWPRPNSIAICTKCIVPKSSMPFFTKPCLR